MLFKLACLVVFCCFCGMYFERETPKWSFFVLWRHAMADISITIITVTSNQKVQFLMFYLHILNEIAIHFK